MEAEDSRAAACMLGPCQLGRARLLGGPVGSVAGYRHGMERQP